MAQKRIYRPSTPSRTTCVSERRNPLANHLLGSSTVITDVVARDVGLSTERYIIFTTHDSGELPMATQQVVDEAGLDVRHMNNHAIEYQHERTGSYATFIARF